MAGPSVSRGTSCGTMDSQAGAMKAAPAPSRKVNSRSGTTCIHPSATRLARAVTTNAIRLLTASSRRRRSRISAAAPAGSARRKAGAVAAPWTSATIRGSGVRVVISQPAPTVFIQVPILEITVAAQSTAKARDRNGSQGEAPSVPTAIVIELSRLISWNHGAIDPRRGSFQPCDPPTEMLDKPITPPAPLFRSPGTLTASTSSATSTSISSSTGSRPEWIRGAGRTWAISHAKKSWSRAARGFSERICASA